MTELRESQHNWLCFAGIGGRREDEPDFLLVNELPTFA
jgi:hypothetical protein